MSEKQKVVNIGLYPSDLERLDRWASDRGVSRSRAVVALLDLATGNSETREQRAAKERGLVAHVPGGPDREVHPGVIRTPGVQPKPDTTYSIQERHWEPVEE